ncbi:MAG: type IV pilus twitching motility protein PilT [Gemmatimonadota bacterium]
MARLDKFIQAMRDQKAEALQLSSGKPAVLLVAGVPRPITRDALQHTQILSLLREIAPAAASEGLGTRGETFTYGMGEAAMEVQLKPSNAGVEATLRSGAQNGVERLGASAPVVPSAPPKTAGRATLQMATMTNDPASRGSIERLLRMLAESGASDLHLRTGEPPIMRRDGELARTEEPPVLAETLHAMLMSIMPAKDYTEFTDTGDADFAYEIAGLARFRGNAALDHRGPMAVFRVVPSTILTVEQLGISREVQALCNLNKGLVLVTGPTGSGKSTTLAGLVDLVNRTRSNHLITIEDPIEFVHESKKCLVTQRQVNVHTKGFKQALRAALREDPDIILVGEMRDLETVSIAIETAETGHLVFGTLHTTTAASTIDRIIDQFPVDRQSQVRVMLSESLRGVVSQVLCRKIGGGRVAAREVLLSIPAISNLIREGKTFQIPSIMQTNRKAGMITLNDALLDLVDSGQIEPREAYLKSAEKTALLSSLKAKKHDTSFLDA